jgi:RNA 2',3'-cyclic 3'-phosphodiesterase
LSGKFRNKIHIFAKIFVKNKMKRIFVAVKIQPDADMLMMLAQLEATLAKDKIKWVDTENLHLTLHFFGETPDEKVDEIALALENVAFTNPFEIQFTKPGIFGSEYKPRVIWLGLHDNEPLIKLENEISLAIEPLGYQSDRQNFVPHLTLGRINFLNDRKYFQKVIANCRSFSSKPQTISDYHLYESKLRASGPEYSIIKSYSPGN